MDPNLIPGCVIPEGYDLALAKQSVGKGWHPILERLFEAKPEWVKITQVKEKFGGLRFYLNDGKVRLDFISQSALHSVEMQLEEVGDGPPLSQELAAYRKMIREAERESLATCEDCGAAGSIRNLGRILTLCDGCFGMRDAEQKQWTHQHRPQGESLQ